MTNNTPSVTPDPSVLIVSGDKNTLSTELNRMYLLGLRHALQAIEANPFTAEEFIKKLIKNNTPC